MCATCEGNRAWVRRHVPRVPERPGPPRERVPRCYQAGRLGVCAEHGQPFSACREQGRDREYWLRCGATGRLLGSGVADAPLW